LKSNNLKNWIIQYAEATIKDYVSQYLLKDTKNFSENEFLEQKRLLKNIEDLFGFPYPLENEDLINLTTEELIEFLCEQMRIMYDLKETQMDLIENGLMRDLEKSFLLQKIDSSWKEHLQNITNLRETIGWRGYGQKDPLLEYKNEAYSLFTAMSTNIRHSVIFLIFRAQPILKI
jgi:preprotein translocase subunit SecA